MQEYFIGTLDIYLIVYFAIDRCWRDKDCFGVMIMMLGSFRIRMLAVVIIVVIVGLIVQSGHSSSDYVRLALSDYVLKDYHLQEQVAELVNNFNKVSEPIPVISLTSLQPPCKIIEVEQGFGPYLNEKSNKPGFSPGVSVVVEPNTLVRPVLPGKVVELSWEKNEGRVLIQHEQNYFSSYSGLKEVLVEEGDQVKRNDILGKTSEYLYFELKDADGAVNPGNLFN